MSLLDLPTSRGGAGERLVTATLRLRVRVHRGRLDRQLAQGRRPATDRRLALRAAQLGRLDLRAGLAAALRDAARSPDQTALTLRRRPQAPIDVAAVRECATEIGELARALTDINPRVQGVAITQELLRDGLGPLYTGSNRDRLRNTLMAARLAL